MKGDYFFNSEKAWKRKKVFNPHKLEVNARYAIDGVIFTYEGKARAAYRNHFYMFRAVIGQWLRAYTEIDFATKSVYPDRVKK